MSIITKSIVVVILLIANVSLAETIIENRSYTIPDHGNLELSFPVNWKSEFGKTPRGIPPTIAIGPEDKRIYLKITVGWNFGGSPKFNDPDSLRERVARSGQGMLRTAVESELDLVELSENSNIGFYYTLTDKNPNPDEWKYLHQGIIVVNDLQLAFTLLSHKQKSTEIDMVFEMLKNAKNTSF